jgi:hypothetical protein
MLPASLSIPISRRQHDANGPRYDPDGIGVRRLGAADHSQQGSCRSRPCAPAREEARSPEGDTQRREAIPEHLSAGIGILKVAALVGVGSGTVQKVKREMVGWMAGGLNVRAWIKPSET